MEGQNEIVMSSVADYQMKGLENSGIDALTIIKNNIQFNSLVIGINIFGGRFRLMTHFVIQENPLLNDVILVAYQSSFKDLINYLTITGILEDIHNFSENKSDILVSSNVKLNQNEFNLDGTGLNETTSVTIKPSASFDIGVNFIKKIGSLTNDGDNLSIAATDAIIFIPVTFFNNNLSNISKFTLTQEYLFFNFYLDRTIIDFSDIEVTIKNLDRITRELDILRVLNFDFGEIIPLLRVALFSFSENLSQVQNVLLFILSPSIIMIGILLFFLYRQNRDSIRREFRYWQLKGRSEAEILSSFILEGIFENIIGLLLTLFSLYTFFNTFSSDSIQISFKIIFAKFYLHFLLVFIGLIVYLYWIIVDINSQQKHIDGIKGESKKKFIKILILVDLILALFIGGQIKSPSTIETNIIVKFFQFQGIFLGYLGLLILPLIFYLYDQFIVITYEGIYKIFLRIINIFVKNSLYLNKARYKFSRNNLRVLISFVFIGFIVISIPSSLSLSIQEYEKHYDTVNTVGDYVISVQGADPGFWSNFSIDEFEGIDSAMSVTYTTSSSWVVPGEGKRLNLGWIEYDPKNILDFIGTNDNSIIFKNQLENLEVEGNNTIVSWQFAQNNLQIDERIAIGALLDYNNTGFDNTIFTVRGVLDHIIPGLGNLQFEDFTGLIFLPKGYFKSLNASSFSKLGVQNIYLKMREDFDPNKIFDFFLSEINPSYTIRIFDKKEMYQALDNIVMYQSESSFKFEFLTIMTDLLNQIVPLFIFIYILFTVIYIRNFFDEHEYIISYLLLKGKTKKLIMKNYLIDQIFFFIFSMIVSNFVIYLFIREIAVNTLKFKIRLLLWDNFIPDVIIINLLRNVIITIVLCTIIILIGYRQLISYERNLIKLISSRRQINK